MGNFTFGLVFRSVFHSVQKSDWAKVKPKLKSIFLSKLQTEQKTEQIA